MKTDTDQSPGEDLERLFSWQERALAAWEQHERRGIIEGMTGTGKTMVAIKAMKRLASQNIQVSPLVVVPTVALLDQWCAKLAEEFPGRAIGRVGDGSHDDFASASGRALPVACVSTIHSAVPAVQNGLFDHCRLDGHKSFLIADECHRYLNEDQKLFNRILRNSYDYTMGLSATVERFAVDGLGEIVYTYSLNAAVVDGVIPRFDVLNVGIELSPTELDEYLELSEKIKGLQKKLREAFPELEYLDGDMYWGKLKGLLNDEDHPLVRALFGCIFKRAAISHTAVAKLRLVPQIISLMVNRAQRKLLVFFERIWTAEVGQEDVVGRVARMVRDAVTGKDPEWRDDPIWCKLFNSQMKHGERDAALEEFRHIGPSALLACRALDEGLDVPAVDGAILVASTQSSRQRLQRIGRTLRRGDGTKRPLIIILYVKGTSDTNVRIGPDDPAFKDAATVHDAEPRQCLEKIGQLLGLNAPPKSASRPVPVAAPRAAEPDVSDSRAWTLLLEGCAKEVPSLKTKLGSLVRRTPVKLELTNGNFVCGEWRMLLDDQLWLEKPVNQISVRRVERLWRQIT